MTLALLLEIAWKGLACAGLTLLALRLLRSRSAAEQSFVAHLGLLATLLLPAATLLLPDLAVPAPPIAGEIYETLVPPPEATPAPAIAEAAVVTPAADGPSWTKLALAAYALPAGLLALMTLASIVGLQRLRSRARVVEDPRWLAALAAAQQRFGHKHGTALLASAELASPISWGILRPIIVLDEAAARDASRAEAIIAHELAHVERLDWLALLVGRLATALFWFNPFAWLLARQAHDLSEQAADDFVLRSNVAGVDYAELLVGAARHAHRPLRLAANGVAPSRSSLGRRVASILDPGRRRIPVRLGWAVLCLGAASVVGTALAAVAPKLPVEARARGRFGAEAAAGLAAIPAPQTQAIARAIRSQDWSARRAASGTRFGDDGALAPLLLALRDESATTRRIAAWGLSELRSPQSVEPLAEALADEAPEVRAEAVRALGDLAAVRHAEAMARLLGDPSAEVRLAAAHALGDLQAPSARRPLETALRDPEPSVRAKAAWALRQIADAEAVLTRFGGG